MIISMYIHFTCLANRGCLAQTQGWPENDVVTYEHIKSVVDEVIYLAVTEIGEEPAGHLHMVDALHIGLAHQLK